jgi:hypothetical protein
MNMKMKKAVLATEHNLNTRKVAIEMNYRFNFVTKKILRSSMKVTGIAGGDKIVRDNKPAIADLTKEIIETKLEVKGIRSLLERRTSKFEGLTEYDQHFIKTFAREAAISFAEYFTKNASGPTDKKSIVYLSPDGEIYREPKSQYYFHMETSSRRMKLVMTLMATKGYVPTRTLVDVTGLASVKSVQSAVQAIRRTAKKKLKLPNFIDGWQDSGYRINPNVILKKEQDS